jgi:DNA-directed RNA polymerase sigma subunit (sigma70/sigma32)
MNIQNLIKFYLQNPHISLAKIAKKFKSSDNTLRKILKKHHVNRVPSRQSPELISKILDTYHKTKSVTVTAKQLSITTTTVSKILNRNDIPRYDKAVLRKPDLTIDQKKLFDEGAPLVKSIIKKMGVWRARYAGMDREDMLSAGMIGLWRAALSYDPNKGTVFNTLATKIIKSEIYDAIEVARFGKRQHGRK